MSTAPDDDRFADEQREAERKRYEQAAAALQTATLDDLLDELQRRNTATLIVLRRPSKNTPGKSERTYSYSGGIDTAHGLGAWAVAEVLYDMMHPAADDADEAGDGSTDDGDS